MNIGSPVFGRYRGVLYQAILKGTYTFYFSTPFIFSTPERENREVEIRNRLSARFKIIRLSCELKRLTLETLETIDLGENLCHIIQQRRAAGSISDN